MGRTELSIKPPPQSFRRAARAKEARRTINKIIPSLLASNYRARNGIREVLLITNAYAWNQNVNPAGKSVSGKGGEKAATSKSAASIVIAANGREKKASRHYDGVETHGTTAHGRNKKGTRRKKADESSEDENAEKEIRAAKLAKEARNRSRLAQLSLGDEKVPEQPPPDVQDVEQQHGPIQIKLYITDTITAAKILHDTLRAANKAANKAGAVAKEHNSDLSADDKKSSEVAVLNMASPLRPGGGFLSGATSQEEHLCMRTTLLPSLHEQFYRLPDLAIIYSPDILVFRPGDVDRLKAGGHDLLRRKERFFINVVSAAMLRYPDIEGSGDDGVNNLHADLTTKRYADPKDRETVERKMQGVLKVMSGKGTTGAVLGAWGCGAYGNPVAEIAQAWKKTIALVNDLQARGLYGGLEPNINVLRHITFAIKDEKMAYQFAESWGDGLVAEFPPHDIKTTPAQNEADEELERLEQEREEAEEKIQELEGQLTQTKFPARIETVLQGLRKQLEMTNEAILERRQELNEDGIENEDKVLSSSESTSGWNDSD